VRAKQARRSKNKPDTTRGDNGSRSGALRRHVGVRGTFDGGLLAETITTVWLLVGIDSLVMVTTAKDNGGQVHSGSSDRGDKNDP